MKSKNIIIMLFFSIALFAIFIGLAYKTQKQLSFKKIGEYQENMIVIKDKKSGKYGYMNRDNQIVIKPTYQEAKYFQEGLAPVKLKKWGYIDKTGKTVIEFHYDSCNCFNNGIARVQSKLYYGYIDRVGNYIIKPCFTNEQTTAFELKKCVLKTDSQCFYYNHDGNLVINSFIGNDYQIVNDWAWIAENQKWGIIRRDGTIILKPQLNDQQKNDFVSSNLFSIKGDRQWLIFDPQKEELAFKSNINRDIKEYAWVIVDGQYGFINKNGKIILRSEYEGTTFFYDGMAGIKFKGKWGFVNSNYDLVIKPIYNSILKEFKNGYALIKLNQKFGFLNKQGILTKPLLDEVNFEELQANTLASAKIGNKWGFIYSTNGKVAINFKYDEVYKFCADIAAVQIKNKWGFVNRQGEIIIRPQYEWVNIEENDQYKAGRGKGKFLIYSDGSVEEYFYED